jgi:hypothetical protein
MSRWRWQSWWLPSLHIMKVGVLTDFVIICRAIRQQKLVAGWPSAQRGAHVPIGDPMGGQDARQGLAAELRDVAAIGLASYVGQCRDAVLVQQGDKGVEFVAAMAD